MKNDNGRPAKNARHHITSGERSTEGDGRRAAELVVRLPFEGTPELMLVADRDTDEARLRDWLRGRDVGLDRLVEEWLRAA